MKKTESILVLFAFLLAFGSGISYGQEMDLSSTWVGETEVPDMAEPDVLTLVIEEVDGKYHGTISDSMGMLADAECKELELEENELAFNFEVFTGAEYMIVYVTLTVEGDNMSGYWETADGSSGAVDLERQK